MSNFMKHQLFGNRLFQSVTYMVSTGNRLFQSVTYMVSTGNRLFQSVTYMVSTVVKYVKPLKSSSCVFFSFDNSQRNVLSIVQLLNVQKYI